MQKNPKQIIESKTIQRAISPYLEQLEKVSQRALNAISDKKLVNSTAKDLTYITTNLKKTEQLLKGEATDRIDGQISLTRLYDEAEKTE